MKAVQDNSDLELQLVVGASALLERFGRVEDLIKKDGFIPNYTFHNIIEGESPTTMAQSTGLGIIEMAMVLRNIKPDFVIIVGDRFEMMAITIAAAYMNIRIAHTMGGEVTGSIDESIRHAITKFAHVHFPANEEAKDRIIKLGEDKKMVFNVGCPRIDLVEDTIKRKSIGKMNDVLIKYGGVGQPIDLEKPFLMVCQHPVTTEYENNRWHIEQTLEALSKLNIQTLMLWPNVDAGSDDISKGIRTFRERKNPEWLYVVKNLPSEFYFNLMNQTKCLVGNSSAGIREGAYIGTPVVNIGMRQMKRMRGDNVIDVDYKSSEIVSAVKMQLENGKYKSNHIYGDGKAGEKITEILAYIDPPVQKVICY